MITMLPREQLIERGLRLRVGNLLEQTEYTLKQARGLGPEFELWLPEGFLAETERTKADLEKVLRDRACMAAEARDATRVQNHLLRSARVWRRKAVALGRMAMRAGLNPPAELCSIGRSVSSLPDTLVDLQRKLGLLHENERLFSNIRLYDQVVGEGESIYQALSAADAEQEKKRLNDLPDAVRNFYATKGTLYMALKMIHDAARAYHADEVWQAAQFNFNILYRNERRKPAQAASESRQPLSVCPLKAS